MTGKWHNPQDLNEKEALFFWDSSIEETCVCHNCGKFGADRFFFGADNTVMLCPECWDIAPVLHDAHVQAYVCYITHGTVHILPRWLDEES
jgi:hypothetical protein